MIAKAARSVLASVVMLVACAPTTPPAPTQTQVQDFLRDYVAAFNTGDDSKLMGLINHDSAVSSIASGRLYRGWDAIRVSSSENLAAVADVRAGRGQGVPLHLRDSHYAGAKGMGHGKGYVYSHNAPHGIATQQYAPDDLVGRNYYEPTTNGAEREISARVDRTWFDTVGSRTAFGA